ncbi:MAG: MBL fold metallo-hydrolase [Candidatus Omnitrophica bacterium]|nr:MBL fold metallo-hydrolase [Candidatus Omnitrophota bacterium]MCF7892592.1 MBL fold metallo-hydrolase [Candidatus Omnitrophota bacterium]
MDFKILFDKNAISSEFKTGWGFAVFIDGVLFDTGEDGNRLLYNLEAEGIDTNSIEKIVLSHDHWDHTGGLWPLLEAKKNLKIYGCPGFSDQIKDKIKDSGAEFIESNRSLQIKPNIYTTGEISGFYKSMKISEQSLVVKSKKGLVAITGCSHPGVVKIVEKVKESFKNEDIHLVFGGFHLMNKEKREIKLIAQKLKDLGINYVGPTHCTGYEAQQIFRKIFGNKYISIKVGKTITI